MPYFAKNKNHNILGIFQVINKLVHIKLVISIRDQVKFIFQITKPMQYILLIRQLVIFAGGGA